MSTEKRKINRGHIPSNKKKMVQVLLSPEYKDILLPEEEVHVRRCQEFLNKSRTLMPDDNRQLCHIADTVLSAVV